MWNNAVFKSCASQLLSADRALGTQNPGTDINCSIFQALAGHSLSAVLRCGGRVRNRAAPLLSFPGRERRGAASGGGAQGGAGAEVGSGTVVILPGCVGDPRARCRFCGASAFWEREFTSLEKAAGEGKPNKCVCWYMINH